jgi:hypothetical protein
MADFHQPTVKLLDQPQETVSFRQFNVIYQKLHWIVEDKEGEFLMVPLMRQLPHSITSLRDLEEPALLGHIMDIIIKFLLLTLNHLIHKIEKYMNFS